MERWYVIVSRLYCLLTTRIVIAPLSQRVSNDMMAEHVLHGLSRESVKREATDVFLEQRSPEHILPTQGRVLPFKESTAHRNPGAPSRCPPSWYLPTI